MLQGVGSEFFFVVLNISSFNLSIALGLCQYRPVWNVKLMRLRQCANRFAVCFLKKVLCVSLCAVSAVLIDPFMQFTSII